MIFCLHVKPYSVVDRIFWSYAILFLIFSFKPPITVGTAQIADIDYIHRTTYAGFAWINLMLSCFLNILNIMVFL